MAWPALRQLPAWAPVLDCGGRAVQRRRFSLYPIECLQWPVATHWWPCAGIWTRAKWFWRRPILTVRKMPPCCFAGCHLICSADFECHLATQLSNVQMRKHNFTKFIGLKWRHCYFYLQKTNKYVDSALFGYPKYLKKHINISWPNDVKNMPPNLIVKLQKIKLSSWEFIL